MPSTSSRPASGGRPLSRAGLAWGAEPNRLVQLACASPRPARALGLAGGAGRNAVRLAAHGWSVHAAGVPGRARRASNAGLRAAAEAA